MVGRFRDSQVSPSAKVPLCMSLIKLGVMNEKAGGAAVVATGPVVSGGVRLVVTDGALVVSALDDGALRCDEEEQPARIRAAASPSARLSRAPEDQSTLEKLWARAEAGP
jgi:hypothetical protein